MSKRRIFLATVALLLILGGIGGYWVYSMVYSSNTKVGPDGIFNLYIPTGADFNTVMDSLDKYGILIDRGAFISVAEKKSYPSRVKAGRYIITNGMSNNDLVNMLRIGDQASLDVTFSNVRLRTELAGVIAERIEADSLSLITMLNDPEVADKYGFSNDNFFCMFIPNTYKFNWNTSADDFADRMYSEYKKFWNEERRNKANLIGLTPSEVSILASIVQSETSKREELSVVAGVYLNRLNTGMLLQADPTLVYAVGDFSIQRVLNVHKKIESPYNTYKYHGLPPGPIALPTIHSIDAVLNRQEHNYIFFCAKEDFSGYHNFAETYKEHKRNAKKFRDALNARKIY